MDTNVLSEVVAVEREIQRCIELERAKSLEWIERVRRECDEEFLREQEKFHEALRKAREEAKQEAESSAAAVVRDALAKAEVLQRMKDKTLVRIIEKRIIKMLPG